MVLISISLVISDVNTLYYVYWPFCNFFGEIQNLLLIFKLSYLGFLLLLLSYRSSLYILDTNQVYI